MPRQSKSSAQSKKVETLKHSDAKRKNIPTAEYQSVMAEEEKRPIRVANRQRKHISSSKVLGR